MKKLKEKLLSFFSQRANVFFVASVILALATGIFLNCGMFVFTMAIIIGIFLSFLLWSLFHMEYVDYSKLVPIGWGCIIFAVITSLCKLCEMDVCGVCIYDGGFAINLIVISILICCIPKISVATKLVPKFDYSIVPWFFFPIFVVLAFCVTGLLVEDSKRDDALFTQEEFVPVKSWTTEIYSGKTVYIVTTPKGEIAIYPWKNPEIRCINSKTQVRALMPKGSVYGINEPYRLEIKN